MQSAIQLAFDNLVDATTELSIHAVDELMDLHTNRTEVVATINAASWKLREDYDARILRTARMFGIVMPTSDPMHPAIATSSIDRAYSIIDLMLYRALKT